MAALGRKASEAANTVGSFASPFTRRVAEAIGNATSKDGVGGKRPGGRKGGGDGGDDGERRCTDTDPSTPFGFLDNVCGPMLRNFNGGLGESGDAEDLTSGRPSRSGDDRGRDRSSRGGLGGGGVGRRPTGSYDYDDETNVTDATGSYEEDDDTYDDDSRRRARGGGGEKRASRGRDRKPRGRSPADSPSDMTGGYSEFDDDTTRDDTATEASSSVYHGDGGRRGGSGRKDRDSKSKKKDDDDPSTKDSEKLITQPLASGFARRCYFTKAGIGRSTQHYEGLTLTGNTVLMLAAAMKLKGCPTICDEDLRRVEQTYPNQFSRLPDELLLSSGWRRISKYCHFSHKPLPDGVPFFHSRKRCHPNGGFYFLLCSAVGMTRLMDVEPLNRDALAVLQTDFPMTCEKAPGSLIEDPNEWTLVNKFCFFSGGPINVEEDVYYRAELGGTEIYMLAFLSPSLSPEELYRLKPSSGGGGSLTGQPLEEDAGPLKSVAAVGEVESVYDLTERDFDDLKLYHLGPCRALPPYLLHPETWAKVLPPRFVSAREEALTIARDWESRYPPSASSQSVAGNMVNQQSTHGDSVGGHIVGESPGSGYVELGGGGGRPPQSTRSGMPTAGPPCGSGGGPGGYPPQYPGHPGMNAPSLSHASGGQDSHGLYYPPTGPAGGEGGGIEQAGYPSPHGSRPPPQYGALGAPPSPMDTELNYYYGPSSGVSQGMTPSGGRAPVALSPGSQFQQNNLPPPSTTNQYSNQNAGPQSPEIMPASHNMGLMGSGSPYDGGPHHSFGNTPQHMMVDPLWRDVQEEGAFGRLGGDQPHDEAIATRAGMYGGMKGTVQGGGMMSHLNHTMGPSMDVGQMEPEDEDQMYHPDRQDPPENDAKSQYTYGDDVKSMASGTSSLMGGAQNRLKQNRMKKMQETKAPRPDLSTKLAVGKAKAMAQGVGDDSTWDTRTDGDSSYGTSLVSGSSFTDTTNPSERNSRRALILQMAKARMKNVKEQSTGEKNAGQGHGGKGEGVGSAGELGDEVAGLELD